MNPRGAGGWRRAEFSSAQRRPPSPHNQRKKGYENYPTTIYSTRTRDRSWTCYLVDVVSPRQETGHL
jgi:hypothetical protein